MSILHKIEKKKVLILGMGREGISTYRFLRDRFPGKKLGVADKTETNRLDTDTRRIINDDSNINFYCGNKYLESIKHFDIIFKSPGISPYLDGIKDAGKTGKIISSNTELFFENCAGKIIGVTGTKGKSTTSSLIKDVLKTGGFDVRLVGNFGTPALTGLKGSTLDTLFVIELSSYQLMNLKRSPHISVILNIAKEHLDYHQTFEAYIEAKQNITKHQNENDYLIFDVSDTRVSKISEESVAKKVTFGIRNCGNYDCFIDGNQVVSRFTGEVKNIIKEESVPLKGRFNLVNIMPSILIGQLYSIKTTLISKAIKEFVSLEHRLEYVKTVNGNAFYNDSLATVPEAAIAAINSFPDKDIILIAGGFNRGQCFVELAKKILDSRIKALVLFPCTGEIIWKEISLLVKEKDDLPEHVFVTTMDEAVNKSVSSAVSGDIILLSPASVSFGQFKDYADRGDQFKVAIAKLW